MQSATTLWVAITMLTVGLAGCTGGELDMLVTPGEDPVTDPFTFKATGPSFDHYEWDFGDGVVEEGKEVQHIYGFANGDVVVRLTGHNEGEEASAVNVARTVKLGGVNTNPIGMMTTNTYWVDPDEPFTVTAEGSTDSNNDPLLYRWTCKRVGDLIPPDLSHPPHEGLGGVPFGVDEWAGLDRNLTAQGTDYGGSLCADLNPTNALPWSRDQTAIQGSFPESGQYAIELLVRDPKGSPWVGRLHMYVSEPDRLKPDAEFELHATGDFQFGSGGSFNSVVNDGTTNPITGERNPAPNDLFCESSTEPPCDDAYDYVEIPFKMVLPSLEGQIDFTYSGGSSDSFEQTMVQYDIVTAESKTVAFGTSSDATRTIGKGDLKSNPDGTPRDYLVRITMTSGAQVTFTLDIELTHDVDPIRWYERF